MSSVYINVETPEVCIPSELILSIYLPDVEDAVATAITIIPMISSEENGDYEEQTAIIFSEATFTDGIYGNLDDNLSSYEHEKPYFIKYRVTEIDGVQANAALISNPVRIGHTSDGQLELIEGVEPTCTETGTEKYAVFCTECGELIEGTEKYETIEPNGHATEGSELVVTKEPTCTENGEGYRICEFCEEIVYETIPATGHTESEPAVENKTEATCTTDGSYDSVVYCSVCGAELSRTPNIIPATGHSWDGGVITTEPTCEVPGVKTFTCTTCGETKTEEVAALGHNYEWMTIKEATETTDGERVGTCSVCGNSVTEVIPRLSYVKVWDKPNQKWIDGRVMAHSDDSFVPVSITGISTFSDTETSKVTEEV